MKIRNNQVRNVSIEKKFEAGIVLSGSEVKAIKTGHASLDSSYVKIIGSEAYLVNSKVFPYQYSRLENYDPSRTRKLLLHKKEILGIKSMLDSKGTTIIPLSLYVKEGKIKIEVAIGKGKKQYDHRREIKKKELNRNVRQELKKWG